MRVPRLPGAALAGGISMLYLSVIVLIPLAAVVDKSLENGFDSFWTAVTNEQGVAALKLTLIASLVVVAINAVTSNTARPTATRPIPRLPSCRAARPNATSDAGINARANRR